MEQQQATNNPAAAIPPSFLHADANHAAQQLIKLSKALVTLTEKETQALVQNDMIAFAILQHEKETLTTQYAQLSKEFRNRLNEFRSIDQKILGQLETLQKDLSEKTRENNSIVEKMQARAKQNTQQTLLTAQELGQKRPVHFEEKQTGGEDNE